MKLKTIVVQNFGPYKGRHEVTIPNTGKVAVVGENGAGKSFLFDAIYFALFGQAANRPRTIYELFNDSARQPVKDGLIELAFELNGSAVQVRRLVNSVARNQMPILIIDGLVVTEGKADQFAAEIARLGLNEQVFLTSAYASQNGAGHLIGLTDGDRRGIFEAVLHLGEYALDHDLVKTQCKQLQRDIDARLSQRTTLTSTMPDRATLLEELSQIGRLVEEQACFKEKADAFLNQAREDLATAKANAQDHTRVTAAIASLDQANAQDIGLVADQQERLKNNETLLSQADSIREAVAAVANLGDAILDLEAERDRLQAAIIATNDAQRVALASDMTDCQTAHDFAQQAMGTATDTLTKGLAQLSQTASELKANQAQLDRDSQQSALTDQVPCQDQPALVSACQLLVEANQAKRRIETTTTEIARLGVSQKEQEGAISSWQEAKAQAAETLALKRIALDLVQAKLMEKPDGIDAIERDLNDVCNELIAKRTALGSYASKTKHAAALELAQERVDGYRDIINQAEARVTARQLEIVSLQAQQLAAQSLDDTCQGIAAQIQGAQKVAAGHAKEIADLQVKTGRVEADLHRCDQIQVALEALSCEFDALTHRLSILDVVREGLSPKGAPALKVDAAGPEISAIINDLLLACYGPRFSVRIDTQRENLSNDNLREVLQVKVIDSDNGQVANVEHLSGGEQAMVKEAISLGLAVFARKHCEVDLRCLLRDETTAPLSDDNGERYMQMLDRALTIGGFEQCLFVSHKRSLQNMADAHLLVADGKITREV